MTARVRPAIVVAAALFVLALWASTSGPVRIWHPAPDRPAAPPAADVPVAAPEDTTLAAEVEPPAGNDESDIPQILQILALVALLALVAFVAYVMRNPFDSLRWRGRKRKDEFAVLPDIADAVTEDAGAQMAALMRGTPRNAIVACWVRLEDTVVAAGLVPNPAETAAELTARVLSTYPVARDAIHELAALYREARFSRHELGEEQRDRAVAALRRLHDDLASRISAPVS